MVKLRRVTNTSTGRRSYFHKWFTLHEPTACKLRLELRAVVELEDGTIETWGYRCVKFDRNLEEV